MLLLPLPSGNSTTTRSLPTSLQDTHVPIITLSLARSPWDKILASPPRHIRLSDFQPTSIGGLRSGLLNDPQVLRTLREESALGFLRWREIERAVDGLGSRIQGSHSQAQSIVSQDPFEPTMPRHTPTRRRRLSAAGLTELSGSRNSAAASRPRMQARARTALPLALEEWESELSIDVARRRAPKAPLSPSAPLRLTSFVHGPARSYGYAQDSSDEPREFPFGDPYFPLSTPGLRERDRISTPGMSSARSYSFGPSHPHAGSGSVICGASTALPFDPLHFPSLLLFSLSLLGPLRDRALHVLSLIRSSLSFSRPRIGGLDRSFDSQETSGPAHNMHDTVKARPPFLVTRSGTLTQARVSTASVFLSLAGDDEDQHDGTDEPPSRRSRSRAAMAGRTEIVQHGPTPLSTSAKGNYSFWHNNGNNNGEYYYTSSSTSETISDMSKRRRGRRRGNGGGGGGFGLGWLGIGLGIGVGIGLGVGLGVILGVHWGWGLGAGDVPWGGRGGQSLWTAGDETFAWEA